MTTFINYFFLKIEDISSSKDHIPKTVFPKGLIIDPKNRTYRTKNINTISKITNGISGYNKGIKKEKVGENTDLSWEVAGAGTQPINHRKI